MKQLPPTKRDIRAAGQVENADCPYCGVTAGTLCRDGDAERAKPHPSRKRSGVARLWADYSARVTEWYRTPEFMEETARFEARNRAKRQERDKRQERADRADARRTAREAERRADAARDAAARRAEWIESGDDRPMRARVLAVLAEFPDGASAFEVAKAMGVEHTTLLTAVHGGLRACVRRGEATRERVEAFVPHSYSGGMSSVYRVSAGPVRADGVKRGKAANARGPDLS